MSELTGDPNANLLMFSGTECMHCKDMYPLVEQLEKEEGLKIEVLESWHNEENAKLLEELDQGRCGGLPFFYNRTTQQFICGNCEYEELKAWAKG
jgi:rubrerythrin